MDKIELSSIPKMIQWHEGMLIGPQHFQQSFFRQEGLVSYHLQNTLPYYWGIESFEYDKGLLVNGVFQVESINAILPDGLEICFTARENTNLNIDLNDFKEELKISDLTIQLAVPTQKLDQSINKGDLNRYNSISGDLISDYNSGDNSILIPRLEPAISLVVGDQLSAKFSGFPIAKISFKDANFTVTDYIPPGLFVSALPRIEQMGKEIIQKLREKANFLSEKAQSTYSSSGLAMILETKETIRSVVTTLPYLETVLRSSNLHPFSLYQALALVVGNLAFLDKSYIPPIFDPYDHNNLLKSFDEICGYIHRVLEQGIQEKYSVYTFSYDAENHQYEIEIEEDWLTPQMTIGVRGQPGMNMQEVREWLEKCMIGSESKLPSMRERRIPGVHRRATEGDEDLIPLRGVQLFKLDMNPEFVTAGEKLYIINPANQIPGTLKADEIVLYVENTMKCAELEAAPEDETR